MLPPSVVTGVPSYYPPPHRRNAGSASYGNPSGTPPSEAKERESFQPDPQCQLYLVGHSGALPKHPTSRVCQQVGIKRQ